MGLGPFDLTGPSFLVFFCFFATILITLTWLWLRRQEWGDRSLYGRVG